MIIMTNIRSGKLVSTIKFKEYKDLLEYATQNHVIFVPGKVPSVSVTCDMNDELPTITIRYDSMIGGIMVHVDAVLNSDKNLDNVSIIDLIPARGIASIVNSPECSSVSGLNGYVVKSNKSSYIVITGHPEILIDLDHIVRSIKIHSNIDGDFYAYASSDDAIFNDRALDTFRNTCLYRLPHGSIDNKSIEENLRLRYGDISPNKFYVLGFK